MGIQKTGFSAATAVPSIGNAAHMNRITSGL
jgi:hypothetical protein